MDFDNFFKVQTAHLKIAVHRLERRKRKKEEEARSVPFPLPPAVKAVTVRRGAKRPPGVTRSMIRAYIKKYPGATALKMSEVLGITKAGVCHHLLQMEDLFRKERTGPAAQMRYYIDAAPIPVRRVGKPKRPHGGTKAEIRTFIRRHPGTTPSQVAKVLGFTAATISYHIQKMKGIKVKAGADGRAKMLYLEGKK